MGAVRGEDVFEERFRGAGAVARRDRGGALASAASREPVTAASTASSWIAISRCTMAATGAARRPTCMPRKSPSSMMPGTSTTASCGRFST